MNPPPPWSWWVEGKCGRVSLSLSLLSITMEREEDGTGYGKRKRERGISDRFYREEKRRKKLK